MHTADQVAQLQRCRRILAAEHPTVRLHGLRGGNPRYLLIDGDRLTAFATLDELEDHIENHCAAPEPQHAA